MLSWALHHRRAVVALFGVFTFVSGVLALGLGTDFFPQVDAGQLRLHVRAPAGTRLEATEELFADVEERLRRIIRENAQRDAREISVAVTDALAAFRRTRAQEDDVTLVVVKVLAPSGAKE
jgi:multidrug efflux pump subunit AcrB